MRDKKRKVWSFKHHLHRVGTFLHLRELGCDEGLQSIGSLTTHDSWSCSAVNEYYHSSAISDFFLIGGDPLQYNPNNSILAHVRWKKRCPARRTRHILLKTSASEVEKFTLIDVQWQLANFRKWGLLIASNPHFRKFASCRLPPSADRVPIMFTNFRKWGLLAISNPHFRKFVIGPQNTCIWGQNTPNTRWQKQNSPSGDM